MAPEVSVVMPCLNEEASVGLCVEKALATMAGLGISGEVVVVDNGSTDHSIEVAKNAGARVVFQPVRGYGSAYLKGISEAAGQFIVMGDADNTYDFGQIGDFLEPLRRGADLVMGSRFKGQILDGAMPWTHRYLGNPVLSGILRMFFQTKISDAHCGMRSFTKAAYEKMKLRSVGMEFASEMVVAALREKLCVEEIPITYHPRIGESKLNPLSDAWRHLRFMLLFSPSYLFLLPGSLAMIFGAALFALSYRALPILGHRLDYHFLIFGGLLANLGMQVVLLDLVAKAYGLTVERVNTGRLVIKLYQKFTLERGIALGAVLFAAGLGVNIYIFSQWLAADFGQLSMLRPAVLAMTLMIFGLQIIFSSFLVALFRLESR